MPEARPADLADEDFCYVTTTRRSNWVRNLYAERHVGLRIADQEWEARAHVVTDTDEDERVRRLLAPKYQGWREGEQLSGWARTALPVAIEVIR